MRLPIYDPTASFSCSSCGWCCDQPWATEISEADAKRYAAFDWAAVAPQLKRKKLFRKAKRDGKVVYRLTKSSGNRCVFLSEKNRCLVHEHLGLEAKPHMCRQFPYLPMAFAGEQRISLNYGCRAVQMNHGPALAEQAEEVRATVAPLAEGGPAPGSVKIRLTNDVKISAAAAGRLLDRIARLFIDPECPSVFAAFAEAIEVLQAAIELSPSELERQLESESGTSATDWSGGAERAAGLMPRAAPAGLPMPVRMLFAATLYPDLCDPDRMGIFGRFAVAPRMMAVAQMKGGYASRLLARNISLQSIFDPSQRVALSSGGDLLLRRYYAARFWQRHTAGSRLSIVSGLHQHLLDLAAVVYFAQAERIEAIRSGALDAAEVGELGLGVVQRGLNVVEFHLANQERLSDKVLKQWFSAALDELGLARAAFGLIAAHAPTAPVDAEAEPAHAG